MDPLAMAPPLSPVKPAPLPAKLVALAVPFTVRAVVGLLVPIPTKPAT
jgi:hypothetical protein